MEMGDGLQVPCVQGNTLRLLGAHPQPQPQPLHHRSGRPRQTPHPHPCRPGASQDPCPFPSLKFGCAQAFYASLRDSAIRPAFSSFDFFTKKGYIVAGSPHGFNWRGNITRRELDESASSTACALCFQSPPFPFFETRPATVASARRDGLETGQQVARREASLL
jgi:hypothetical protein